MVMENSVKMSPVTLANGNFGDYEKVLDTMLREQHPSRAAFDRERELNLYRSGSAPPTVEGSRTAVGSLFGHTEFHHMDGRDAGLPSPILSKEDWRMAQRFPRTVTPSFGKIGDRRRKESGDGDGSSSSLFSLQPGFPVEPRTREQKNLLRQASVEWLEMDSDGLIGLGARRKSFTDAVQEEIGRSTSISRNFSHPVSRNALDNVAVPVGVSEAQFSHLHSGLEAVNTLYSGATTPGLARAQSLGSSISHSFSSSLGSSLNRSITPDPQLIGRSPSPCLPPAGGRVYDTDKETVGGLNGCGGVSYGMADCGDVVAALSVLSLSKDVLADEENHVEGQLNQEFADQPDLLLKIANDHRSYLQQKIISKSKAESSSIPNVPLPVYEENGLTSNRQVNLSTRSLSTNLYKKIAPVGSTSIEGSSGHYQNYDTPNISFTGCNSNAYSASQGLPAKLNSQFIAGVTLAGGPEGQYLTTTGNHGRSPFQIQTSDLLYAQYSQRTPDFSAQAAASLGDPSLGRYYLGTSHMDLPGNQKAYLGALLTQQKLQYGMPFASISDCSNHGFYGSPTFDLGRPYLASPISSPVISSLGPQSSLSQNERLSRFLSVLRTGTGGSMGPWNPENSVMEGFSSSMMEESKNIKTRLYELSEIVDHVVELCADQYGSRFIQQKLETASVEEKNKIFPEILPHARSLMTDVFGNYVIQKFFEHGTESQRKQLASQLLGHVLTLSLQMYGCRVIQKALEVVDVDQQTQIVSELDGSVMKCVRDQNGNHVIQKCIECVPQERIQFIITSFYVQVVALSTHPYGCRVIQRVLEHCDDAKTQSIMMDEILQSVCTLAQDQYGNYVVQHVLQHGKPEERSSIISKLAGQIVKMSQQKFASNVVEKCLSYGSADERQLLINEMLGSTDENEPLQAMMKDQFANYVVQKVLETCDDQNLELILSRIKVHLNALKRYTYGKHIVARVEKLVTTGERRIGILSYSS